MHELHAPFQEIFWHPELELREICIFSNPPEKSFFLNMSYITVLCLLTTTPTPLSLP